MSEAAHRLPKQRPRLWFQLKKFAPPADTLRDLSASPRDSRMRHVKRSEEPDSIESVEVSPQGRSRVPARSFKILLAVVLSAGLGGLAYFFAEQLLALWSPTTVVTDMIRMVFGGAVAVLGIALSVLLRAAANARGARKREMRGQLETATAVVPETEDPTRDSSDVLEADPISPSPEEMMLSLESELSAAAAELAAELERAANAGVPMDPYGVDGTELDIEGEEPPATLIVAADPPQAVAAIAIPVWVDDVVPEEIPPEEIRPEEILPEEILPGEAVAHELVAEESPDGEAPDHADPAHSDPALVERAQVDPVGLDASVVDAPVEDTPDADGNTNPTVRVLQAQIRSLEEALFRQAAAEGHSAEPQPEIPRAASKDEVTREVLARVRHTIRGLGARMDGDPAAADVLARVEAAVARLAETGFFVRPALSEPDVADFASTDALTAPGEHQMVEPAVELTVEPSDQSQAPSENWESADGFAVATEVAAEFAAPRTATAVIDHRPLAELLAAEVVLEEAEIQDQVIDQADVVLPVPAGPPAPVVQRSRRWRRGTPGA